MSAGDPSSKDVNQQHQSAHSAAAAEQQINELVQQSRVYEAYLNDIMTRQVTVARTLEEARLASTTIQATSPDNQVDSLMPIGIGLHLHASLPPVKKLLVNLGAGVAVEKSREDALNFVEARIKEFEVAARQLEAQRVELSMRMQQLQAQVNQLLRAGQ